MKVLEEGTNSAVELLSFLFCGAVEQPLLFGVELPVQELVQNSWHEASCTGHPAPGTASNGSNTPLIWFCHPSSPQSGQRYTLLLKVHSRRVGRLRCTCSLSIFSPANLLLNGDARLGVENALSTIWRFKVLIWKNLLLVSLTARVQLTK